MLVVLNDVLIAEQVALTKRCLQQGQWQTGKLTAGVQSAQVKNNLQLAENDPYAVQARQEIMNALTANGEFFSAVLPKKIFPLMFNRYAGEQNSFGSHVDNAVRTPANGGPWVRTDVSATLFLSEPDEYEGGALVIQDSFGEQRVKLSAGSMVLYPSSSVHRVEPVTKGERWACFFWVESMVRATDQRRALYELDQSIVQLRNTLGDVAPIVQLTAVYHNLLRQWVDT